MLVEGPPDSWKAQYQPFIYAKNLSNVAITGTGTIDGGGAAWWNLKNKTNPKGKFPRNLLAQRPYNIRFDSCRHVLVRDIRIVNQPFWNLVGTLALTAFFPPFARSFAHSH